LWRLARPDIFGTVDATRPVVLSDFLSPKRVKIPLRNTEKDALLRELVAVLVEAEGLQSDEEEIFRAVQAREEVLSTGIGDGVALPHAKSEVVPDLVVAAGVSAEPVEFDALDGRPVQIFFLLLAPERAMGAHIKALSRISRLLRQESLRRRLLEATDAREFARIVQEAEATALSNRS
jgi:mannitol/fructose-specific phosphotransferase system IIA component (Ntr-type)